MFDDTTGGALGPLAVIAMVALAGCSAGAGPLTGPDPYTETGDDLDADALSASHAAALHDAGSYRSATNLTVTSGTAADAAPAVAVERTARVDADDDRALATSRLDSGALDGDGLRVVTYTENDTTAREVVIDAEDTSVTRYDAARAPYDDGLLAVSPVDDDARTEADLVAAGTESVDWTQAGVERHEGDWVTRYEASGPDNVSDVEAVVAAALTEADRERTGLDPGGYEVTAANATILVSPDGVVRQFSLTVVATTDDGDAVTVTVTLTTDGLGATDVQRPDWYGEATDDLDG